MYQHIERIQENEHKRSEKQIGCFLSTLHNLKS